MRFGELIPKGMTIYTYIDSWGCYINEAEEYDYQLLEKGGIK